MLSILARRKKPVAEATGTQPGPRDDAPVARAADSCLLAACATGSRATVLQVRCGEDEACRLRALGLSEGACVNVVDARHCMLLEVRGTRLALGRAITTGITVQPQQS